MFVPWAVMVVDRAARDRRSFIMGLICLDTSFNLFTNDYWWYLVIIFGSMKIYALQCL